MLSRMFDGQYRSKPQVSLRGASKKEERGDLLARVTEERELRESSRRRQLAALSIQAHYRGHRSRQQLYSRLRVEFDQSLATCSTPDHALSLARLLPLFYTRRQDTQRLISLCQKWLQFSRPLITHLHTSMPLCARHLLTACAESMTFDPTQNIAIPLRMLETFLSPSLFTHAPSTLHQLLSHLLQYGGYFRCLRTLLEARVPPPDGPGDHTHSPLTSSLLEYISRPFKMGGTLTTPLYPALTRELLCPPLTPHLCHILIPHLLTLELNFELLVNTLLASQQTPATAMETLYVLLQLVHPRLQDIDQISLTKYLKLISLLLANAPSSHVTSSGNYDDDDEEESMDEDESDPLEGGEGLRKCCVSTITSQQVAVRLKKETRGSVSSELVGSLCSLCYQIIRSGVSPSRTRLFQLLSLNYDLLSRVWTTVTSLTVSRSFGDPVGCLHQLSKGVSLPPAVSHTLLEQLITFTSLFTLYLSTLHDAEFYSELDEDHTHFGHTPFTLDQMAAMVTPLRDVFIVLQLEKHLPSYLGNKMITPSVEEWNCLKTCVHDMLCALYERDCRRAYCPPGSWAVLPTLTHIPPQLFLDTEDDGEDEGTMVHASPSVLRQAELLRKAPFVFPFIERVRFFTSLVTQDRSHSQGRHQEFLMGPSIKLSIRRTHIYEDAFSELAQGQDLRHKFRVSFVNAQGLDEVGIDGGGLFREFLNEILKTGFDPNRGYFTITQDGLLYPNPQAPLITPDYAMHYQFLGAMLGKALYEGLLVELPFAGFFLCKLADRGRGIIGAHHLASFDADLYRHLLSLKHYPGDMAELDLNFTLLSDQLGHTQVIELKPGGADISVTRSNCIEYIHLVSHYKLNVQLERQFQAFRRGLSSVIPLHWLRLFSQGELQVLVSGARVPISVEDLKQHTVYSGEYREDHPVIRLFWDVVGGFSETEKRQLLKFVTSCSRPPLLGFKQLSPPLNISPAIGEERLPSASTCMNVLKLPQFQDSDTLKHKLLYAIQSGAGFEMS